MTFLNPAVLTALVAASIPVILHFINLRKIKRIEFSTLYFLKELKKSKIRNLKIKQWLLLFLRLALIVFLVLAFAKPAAKSESFSALGENAKRTIYVILDNSYSMAAGEKNNTKFSKAKEIALKIVSKKNLNDDVFPITTAPVKMLANANVNKTIEKLEVSYVKGNLPETLLLAGSDMKKKQTLENIIFVLSDFQKSTAVENQLKNALAKLKENAKVYFVKFNSENINNLAVKKVTLRNGILFPGKTVKFDIEIENTDAKNSVNKTVALFLNNEKSAQTNVELAGGAKKKIELKTTLKNAGLTEALILSEDDDLPFDNSRYVLFNVREKTKIIVTAEKKKDTEFLLAALSGEVSQLNETKFVPTSKLSATELQNADVLFAVGGISKALAENFLKYGKTLALFPSAKNLNTTVNLLKALKINASSNVSKSEEALLFEKINFKHPVLDGIFSAEKQSRIGSPEISKYLKLKNNGRAETIIALENGDAFLEEFERANGKVFVFAVPPNLAWSDFPLKPIFAPLLNGIALYAASQGIKSKSVFAGEPYFINILTTSFPRLKIIAPGNNEFYQTVDYTSGKRFVKFTKTNLPGFYYVYSDEKLTDAFTVNADTRESEENFYDVDELKKLSGKTVVIYDGNDATKIAFLSHSGTEFWRLFLLLALLAALAEMYVAKTSKKDFEEFQA